MIFHFQGKMIDDNVTPRSLEKLANEKAANEKAAPHDFPVSSADHHENEKARRDGVLPPLQTFLEHELADISNPGGTWADESIFVIFGKPRRQYLSSSSD
jgi:hypothetical protein